LEINWDLEIGNWDLQFYFLNRGSMGESKLIIISGPSGAGKTTLIKKLFQKKVIRKCFLKSISCTTRPRRKGEREGKDYYFISKKQFIAHKKGDYFLETQKVVDDYYGTPITNLTRAETEKKHLLLCIDVKGGIYLKKKTKRGRIVSIFISVPGRQELYRRLRMRAEETAVIRKRVRLAVKELESRKEYDYVIVNNELGTALKQLESILTAECIKRSGHVQ
jgi:guanylate kinase